MLRPPQFRVLRIGGARILTTQTAKVTAQAPATVTFGSNLRADDLHAAGAGRHSIRKVPGEAILTIRQGRPLTQALSVHRFAGPIGQMGTHQLRPRPAQPVLGNIVGIPNAALCIHAQHRPPETVGQGGGYQCRIVNFQTMAPGHPRGRQHDRHQDNSRQRHTPARAMEDKIRNRHHQQQQQQRETVQAPAVGTARRQTPALEGAGGHQAEQLQTLQAQQGHRSEVDPRLPTPGVDLNTGHQPRRFKRQHRQADVQGPTDMHQRPVASRELQHQQAKMKEQRRGQRRQHVVVAEQGGRGHGVLGPGQSHPQQTQARQRGAKTKEHPTGLGAPLMHEHRSRHRDNHHGEQQLHGQRHQQTQQHPRPP